MCSPANIERLRSDCVQRADDDMKSLELLSSAHDRCPCHLPWVGEMHGLAAFVKSTTPHQRMFWSALMATCCAASIAFGYLDMKDFSEHSSVTRIKIYPVKRLKFPTLVFCPRYSDALHVETILEDVRSRIQGLDEEVAHDVLRYLIAGSGLNKVDVEKWSPDYMFKLNRLFMQWRGNRTQQEMFDFVFVENGYTCKELFQRCRTLAGDLDCCNLFRPTFVLLRGRCFSLIDDYYQEDFDESGKIILNFNEIKQGQFFENATKQLVMYLRDVGSEVGPVPKVYLDYGDWNRFVFVQKRVSMLPKHSGCSVNESEPTCLVRKTIEQRLLNPFNCSVLPFTAISHLENAAVCDIATVVQNYKDITAPMNDDYNCLPACERTENQYRLRSSVNRNPPSKKSAYLAEASFGELQYEEYKEISLTTPLNFLSQLGGQTGLFVGCSLATFVQILLAIVKYIHDVAKTLLKRHVVVPLNSCQ